MAAQGFLVRVGPIQAVAQLWGRSWVGGFQHEGIWAPRHEMRELSGPLS